MIAKGLIQLGEMNREVEETLDEHGQAMEQRPSPALIILQLHTCRVAVAEDDGWMEGGIRYMGFIKNSASIVKANSC
ncbi:hypothetical protein L3X38_018892 [Prunus dulcis]|uniref:Uncharacterized protein n=1 Tax=Prunus dulcis TaxID=3755 RepID=A0AAD4W9W1_PRUDU|nr:hypothetical protein L3X38_018892 [Prunus dulcis]